MKATEEQKAKFKKYYSEHKEKKREDYLKHQVERKEKGRTYNRERKLEILSEYSGNTLLCIRCGFNDIRALSIDHINGKGESHRRSLGITSGNNFYQWLKKNNYPEGYQVLCMNCQAIKRIENDEHYKG